MMETNDIIEAQINLTAQDRAKAMYYNYFVKRKLILFEIVFLSLVALILIALRFTGLCAVPNILFYIAVGVFMLIAFFFLYIKLISMVGGIGKTRYITITPQTLTTRVSGEKKEFTVKWEDFTHRAKTKNYYILYPDTTQFLIIPKRYFSREEIEKINSYIH
ncbi:MAG: YcxB family protein [Clostridia bacterium]